MSRFDYFVIFAEMRTGSNFLETNINALNGLICHGEAFNAHFIGYPKSTDILGVSQAERDADPFVLLDRIKAQAGVLSGFRYFSDHDPRILETVLADPRCAKIILTRNPVESFVSREIAAATGQWKLTNVRNAKSEQASFDGAAFEEYLTGLQQFQIHLLNALQRTGQTAFYLAYEDLQELAVMNGLAQYLGSTARLDSLDRTLKKQNPAPMAEKVVNFEEMAQALVRLDRFNLSRTPNFEPRRGAAIPSYIAAGRSPLLYMPIRSGPEVCLRSWLEALDGVPVQNGFTQKTLRQWKLAHPGHRSFTVLRHPLARAHAAFCTHILGTGPGSFLQIRQVLRKVFKLPIPRDEPDATYDDTTHHAAFLGFLGFLKANLSGQTSLRIDAAWASQLAILQGMAEFGLPDMILREERLGEDMKLLTAQIDHEETLPALPDVTDPHAARLEAIYDATLETASRDAYPRDYMWFGFENWR